MPKTICPNCFTALYDPVRGLCELCGKSAPASPMLDVPALALAPSPPQDALQRLWTEGSLAEQKVARLLMDWFAMENEGAVAYDVESAFVRLGDRAVDPLLAVLLDPRAKARHLAAQALGAIRSPHAISGLIRVAEDSDTQVRLHVTRALTRLYDPRIIAPLLRALSDEQEAIALPAVEAVAKYHDRRAVEPLVRLLERSLEESEVRVKAWLDAAATRFAPLLKQALAVDIRIGAVKALGTLEDARAIAPLLAMVQDDGREIQSLLQARLGRWEGRRLFHRQCQEDLALLRYAAATALMDFGQSGYALARRIVACPARTAEQRLATLESLYRLPVRQEKNILVNYLPSPPPPLIFCRALLEEDREEAVRADAKEIVDYLTLMRGSERDARAEAEGLLRPSRTDAPGPGPAALVRPVVGNAAPQPRKPGWWHRLFPR